MTSGDHMVFDKLKDKKARRDAQRMREQELEYQRQAASAAERQAAATIRGNILVRRAHRVNAVIAFASIGSAIVAAVSAWVAMGALNVSREASRFETRPWVDVQFAPGSGLRVDAGGGTEPFYRGIEFKEILRNYGRAPAINVNIAARLYPGDYTRGGLDSEIEEQCAALHNVAEGRAPTVVGFKSLPDVPPGDPTLPVSHDIEIDASELGDTGSTPLVLIGCLRYTSIAPTTLSTVGTTRFAYELFQEADCPNIEQLLRAPSPSLVAGVTEFFVGLDANVPANLICLRKIPALSTME